MTVYGYARVSSIRQTLAVQEASLHEAGAAKVFKEKISGAASNRAQLYRLLKTIDAGGRCLGHETGSAGPIKARPAQRPRQDYESRRDLQVVWRRVGLTRPLPTVA